MQYLLVYTLWGKEMKVVTRESRAAEAAELWWIHHTDQDGTWIPIGRVYQVGNTDSQIMYEKLQALGLNPDPDKVDEIIGNISWTRVPACDECNQETQSVCSFYNRSDRVVSICGVCLLKALNIMEGDGV
jgi:hypothetical protein